MQNMDQNSDEIPPQYYEIGKVIDEYKKVICQKFRTNQCVLIEQLEQKARKLKENISFYKKQTSVQNIEKLISKRRHQKQFQRLSLQVEWRNLTQRYKKLQQEQKKINEENRQNKFDLENIESKIDLVRQQNKKLSKKIQQLKEEATNQPFVTQINQNYRSPYKINTKNFSSSQISEWKKTNNINKKTNNFRLKLQQKIKKTQSGQNKQNLKNTQKLQGNIQQKQTINQELVKSPFSLFKNEVFLKHLNQEIKHFQMGNCYQKEVQKKQYTFAKGQKWNQLMYYLNKPQVRDKIFDVLRK